MTVRRPRIGVTGPTKGGIGAWAFTALSIWVAGGRPLRSTPQQPRHIDELDGLVLGGGADIKPVTYGQQPADTTSLPKGQLATTEWLVSLLLLPIYWVARYFQRVDESPVDQNRDEVELELLEQAIAKQIPILGICRGMQLMNVHFKGTLHQEIRGFYGEKAQISSIFPRKRVTIEADTHLHGVLNTTDCTVNALHHQAIDQPGEDIRVTARETDTGITQAIEHSTYEFAIGVQWHPEYLIQIPRQRRLFKQLVKAAS